MSRVWRVFLEAAITEARQDAQGAFYEESERGHWICQREIELPFVPKKGVELILNQEGELSAWFDNCSIVRLDRLIYDVQRELFICVCSWNVMFFRESTPESLTAQYPGWQFRWITDDDIDDDGRLKASNAPDE